MVVRVEVVFSPAPGAVDHRELTLPVGSTVGDALQASGLLERHPLLSQPETVVGVWGRRCPLQQVLRERDRVEIYRPLTVDPKEARRRRQLTQPKRPRRPLSGSPTR